MLRERIGRVLNITRDRLIDARVQELKVDVGGNEVPAINYADLAGPVSIGDDVLLNTTAVDLGLGTGGVHFVVCNLTNPLQSPDPSPGHIMKLRYTPLQTAVLAVEEDDSPHQDAIRGFQTLAGIPVLCCELHSQIAPAVAAVKALAGDTTRIAYVMTDGAALPIGFSRLVYELKDKGLIDTTVTCGQAFGGDIEAINIYTGLIAAKEVGAADVIIVCQGPGNAGAGSKYGFSGIEQGEAINAVNALGGNAIAVLRMSFADQRERHRGISHHTLTILESIAVTPALVAIPELPAEKARSVQQQLLSVYAKGLHLMETCDGEPGIDELKRLGIKVKTMGRSIDEDREFFLAASCAGVMAVALLDK